MSVFCDIHLIFYFGVLLSTFSTFSRLLDSSMFFGNFTLFFFIYACYNAKRIEIEIRYLSKSKGNHYGRDLAKR